MTIILYWTRPNTGKGIKKNKRGGRRQPKSADGQGKLVQMILKKHKTTSTSKMKRTKSHIITTIHCRISHLAALGVKKSRVRQQTTKMRSPKHQNKLIFKLIIHLKFCRRCSSSPWLLPSIIRSILRPLIRPLIISSS